MFDGGYFQGDFALVNLEGLKANSHQDFVKQAAERALSNSELGYVLISDKEEGALFDKRLGEKNRNSGEYLGVKTISVNPGEEYGFMLVPNGTVEEVFEKPNIGWSKRPVFSMSTESQIDTFSPGQFVDLTGDGKVFVFEDVRADRPNFDGDYNDFVFSVNGLKGNAASVEEYINSEKDWRSSSNGIEFLEIAAESVNQDNSPPTITVELANDTGEDETDKMTADPSLTGTVIDESDVVSFEISFSGESDSFVEVKTELENDGSFVLEQEVLEEVLGETLPLGVNTIYLRATDEHELESAVLEFEFILEEEDLLGPEIESLAEIYGLNSYPVAASLPPNGTRQLSVKINNWANSPELTTDVGDISYVVEDSDILEVSSEGLITGLAGGETNITVQYGEAEVSIPVLVEPPETGPSLVDELGGVVEGEEDWLVMAPPGALIEETEIDISPLAASELSLEVPDNYSFVTGFELELGDNPLNLPVQLAIPAPEDVEAGTEVFFMYEGEIPNATGNFNPMWVVQESGIVGEDGIIRTQSPPWQGVRLTGEYSVVIPDFEYSVAHLRLAQVYFGVGAAMLSAQVASVASISPLLAKTIGFGAVGGSSLLWGGASISAGLSAVGAFATVPVLLDLAEKSVTAITIPKVGLPYETPSGVQLNPGQFYNGSLTVDLPILPNPDALALAKVEVTVPPPPEEGDNEIAGKVVFLEGENFGEEIDDLEVNFHLGGKVYPGTILPEEPGLTNLAEGKIAAVSDYVPLGEGSVSVEKTLTSIVDTQEIMATEPVKLPAEPRVELALTTMPFADRVNAINALNPLEVINDDPDVLSSKDLLLASIPVGTSEQFDRPRYTAATSEATRAYVTLENSQGVALVDVQGFKQLDTQLDVEGVNPIPLPDDSSPRSIVIDPTDSYAYIGDYNLGRVYVIDIDPSSDDYNQHVETIEFENVPEGFKKLAISSDGKRLFATTPTGGTSGVGQIMVANIDFLDRPADGEGNTRKWHQQIGAIDGGRGTEGISATSDELKIAFTNRYDEPKGYGVLTIVNNDPLNFEATTTYTPMSLGPFDDFDVNEAVDVEVIYDEDTDTDYAFVAGYNMRNFTLDFGSYDGKSNVGIIKDALGDSPQLVAGTQRIPFGNTSDVTVSSDGRFLFATYPGIESTLAFDVGEIIETINSPDAGVRQRLETEAIDEVNPDVSLAADLEIVRSNPLTREVEWRVPSGSQNGPISTGSLPWGLFVADKPHYVELKPVEEDSLEETRLKLEWTFNLETPEPVPEPEPEPEPQRLLIPVKPEEIQEINVYVSVFPDGEGLRPENRWEGLREQVGIDDYNPNRVLTAEWEPSDGDNWTWTWNGESLSVPRSDSSVPQEFSLPEGLELTGGQTYHWAVEVTINGEKTVVAGQFDTTLGAAATPGSNAFSSVTVLTPGVEPGTFDFPQKTVDAMAAQLEKAGAAVMDYNPFSNSDKWLPVTYNWNQKKWDYSNESPEPGRPLVLLADWMERMDAGDFSNAGVAEAAADSLFVSLADLDWDYGGRVGGSNGLYDENGDLIRKHGAVFNAPLHFIGFGQGAVVNTEIIQRLGTYFPEAGGVQDSGERDLHKTAVEPFEYNPETVPQFRDTLARMLDPEIVVWDNVTYADNYYQVQGKEGEGSDTVLTGKALEKIPNMPGAPGKPDRADINYELENWAGFDRAKGEDNAHRAAVAWYGGTANLNESEIPADQQLVFRRLGDLILNDLGENNEKSWYVPGHTKSSFNHGDTKAPWEGIGTGWFYSVNGGGSKLRPYEVGSGTNKSKKSKDELGNFEDYLKNNRRPVTYDNTYAKGAVEKRLRGDYATPTVFNGNFELVAPKNDPNAPLPNIPIPGWSDKSASVSMSNLVDWRKITTFRNERNNLGFEGTQLNYTLKLDRDNNNIVHNPQVVPDWGLLRLDLHAPGTTKDKRGELVVTLKTPDESIVHDQTIVLQKASNTLEKVPLLDDNNQPTGTEISIPSSYGGDRYKIDYGRNGFESFFIPVPETLRGKMVNVDLELRAEGQNKPKVYLDNVFFQSNTLKFGNPTAARNDSLAYSPNNYLIEKPQYTMSFNKTRNTPNWVSWTLDGSWPSKIPSSKRPGGFAEDPDLNGTNWYKINHNDYNFDAEVEKYYSDDEYKHFEVPERDFSPPLKPYFWPVRGHLSPSKDRSRSIKDLYSTFLTTNIVPQDLKGNSGVWREWEKHLQEKVKNFQHKIYVISGVLGTGGDGKDYNDFSQFNAQTNKDEKIAVPSKLWKVVMGFNKNSTSEYPDYAYATIVPNNALDLLNVEYNNKGKPKKVTPKKWTDFKKTINVLELALNKDLKDSDFRYDFLSNVKDPQIKERLKNTK